HRLGGALAVGGRGVHQGAAGVGEGAQLARGLVAGGVPAPGQGPQAETRQPQSAAAQNAVLHATTRLTARHRSTTALLSVSAPPRRPPPAARPRGLPSAARS